ncbi:MAG: protein PhnA [Alphaproteobacteria bacterium]|jgi:protein PhnA
MQSALVERSNNQCEICQADKPLNAFFVPESPDLTANCHIYICHTCLDNIEAKGDCDLQHLRCLTTSMWSPTPAVQVMSYRLLHKCLPESWAQDAIDMLYLEEDILQWAQAGLAAEKEPTLDVNGIALQAGDAVTVIKDLDVKGANFIAKRGTPVRNIGLSENPLHIEGKINGQRIVIIAAYTKKN